MMFRLGGWPAAASVAVCVAATGAVVAFAEDVDPSLITGSTRLVWGGPVPEPAKPGEHLVYVPSIGLNGEKPVPQVQDIIQAPYVDGIRPPKPHAPVLVAPGEEVEEGEGRESEGEADEPPARAAKPSKLAKAQAATPPRAAAPVVPPPPEEDEAVAYAPPTVDPWDGLKSVTPGLPKPRRNAAKSLPSYASLEPMPSARSRTDASDLPGRGALEDETPTGYQTMPRMEAMCRKALSKLGVRFVDVRSIGQGRSCGIEYPVKVTEISPGVAMKPAGVLNCMAALRVSQWVSNEVKPAAQSALWKKPIALYNASSYRCSRIAGTRTVSEHASGNAIDVAGFQLADGTNFDVRKKGVFDVSEKSFQQRVRTSACRYFGTVLGPGYNRDHADHLHLDLKQRRRGVCK
ncbi:hypothetical protein GCM10011390_42700 [Aureimonas endophytica]|uniref:Extensin-like C-terminal domain-containing protein n=1 Tax=Aureimonas endophytica TaxID=2027858 RepID=A0A916ZYE3_9HYPH|nr:extensin family protein [Aureimonas endophytica]GGE19006.1 hypothetical protein GCM10011390_42700 [Aureimonas endophytica]